MEWSALPDSERLIRTVTWHHLASSRQCGSAAGQGRAGGGEGGVRSESRATPDHRVGIIISMEMFHVKHSTGTVR